MQASRLYGIIVEMMPWLLLHSYSSRLGHVGLQVARPSLLDARASLSTTCYKSGAELQKLGSVRVRNGCLTISKGPVLLRSAVLKLAREASDCDPSSKSSSHCNVVIAGGYILGILLVFA